MSLINLKKNNCYQKPRFHGSEKVVSDLVNEKKYCEVAVDFPIGNGVLTYSQPRELNPGELVEVPLGEEKLKAVF